MSSYYPKRSVKSFQDLEVYQKVLSVAVVVSKRLFVEIEQQNLRVKQIGGKLLDNLLSLPALIASAHSKRFSNQEQALARLEETMLRCNLAVVYLELYRDLRSPAPPNVPLPKLSDVSESKSLPKDAATTAAADVAEIELSFFEEQIKNLLSVRMKIMHLQRSWRKFFENKTYEKQK